MMGTTGEEILIVDDDPDTLGLMRRFLSSEGFHCQTFATGAGAIQGVKHQASRPDVVLVDLHLPDYNGVELIQQLRLAGVDAPAIVVTAESSVRKAVDAMKNGAFDYVTKPFESLESLERSVRKACEHRRLQLEKHALESKLTATRTQLVGSSSRILEVRQMVEAVAGTNATVLVTGATGTGKELVARMVHECSPRHSKKFVPVNCGELAESVLESELFGHAKGAFTGANSARQGLFVSAKGGTLFLDEVGELEITMQSRLLRVLEGSMIRPVGADELRKIDVRIVAATNRDLKNLVKHGAFRKDLLYRLNVFEIPLPALSERVSDIPEIARHLVRKHSVLLGRDAPEITEGTMKELQRQPWPGNVRQLENVIERALILCDAVLDEPHLHLEPRGRMTSAVTRHDDAAPSPFQEARHEFEYQYLVQLLEQTGGNRSEAARLACLDPSNFRRLLKRHQIT